jgi:hypothetical protein
MKILATATVSNIIRYADGTVEISLRIRDAGALALDLGAECNVEISPVSLTPEAAAFYEQLPAHQ